MGLTAPGIGSNLDVKGIVDKLVNAELIPAQNRLNLKATKITTNVTALGQVKSVLAKLQDSLSKLYDVNAFYKMKTTTSDSDHFSVTTSEKANPALYNIIVKQMAQRQSLSSQPTSATNLGTGTLTVQLGTYNSDKTSFTNNPDKPPIVINVTAGNDSLQSICDTINKANPAIQANIVKDNQGSRITLTSNETGEAMAMQITVSNNSGNALSTLGYDPTMGINNMTETAKAQNSEVVVNGISLFNSSNNLKDAITGITLDLKKAEPDKTITLNLENDKSALTSLIKDFIKQYNDSMATLNSFTGYDRDSKTAGPLQSDASLRTLKGKLSSWATELMETKGNIKSLVDLGIKTDLQGLLIIKDENKFNATIENNYKDIGALFAKTASATDPNIKVNTLDKSIKAGTYNVILDTYVQGSSMTGSLGGLNATSSNGITLKGTGILSQLSIDVLGGVAGSRGSITISDGIAVRLDGLLDSYLSEKGDLTNKTNQLTKQLENLNKDNDTLIARVSKLEERYLKQFNALDAVLAKLQKTTGMLDQLNNLPKIQ